MKHCCWWCTLEIKGEELHLPYKQDKCGKIHTMGKFCSWECIKTYNLKENNLNYGKIQGNTVTECLREIARILE